MINVLILTHGDFAEEVLKSAELIIGKQENVFSITLNEGEDIDKYREKIAKSIGELGRNGSVLIFTDLYGGTPSNSVALSLISQYTKDAKFECIAGFNFPMLIEALTSRHHMSLTELKQHSIEIGYSSIKDLLEEINVND